jgi:hypothetical protein
MIGVIRDLWRKYQSLRINAASFRFAAEIGLRRRIEFA